MGFFGVRDFWTNPSFEVFSWFPSGWSVILGETIGTLFGEFFGGLTWQKLAETSGNPWKSHENSVWKSWSIEESVSIKAVPEVVGEGDCCPDSTWKELRPGTIRYERGHRPAKKCGFNSPKSHDLIWFIDFFLGLSEGLSTKKLADYERSIAHHYSHYSHYRTAVWIITNITNHFGHLCGITGLYPEKGYCPRVIFLSRKILQDIGAALTALVELDFWHWSEDMRRWAKQYFLLTPNAQSAFIYMVSDPHWISGAFMASPVAR